MYGDTSTITRVLGDIWHPGTVRLVSSDEPYVRLPDRIALTLAEAGELLEILDVAVETASTDSQRTAAREAAETITAKLWPESATYSKTTTRRRLGTDDYAAHEGGDPLAGGG
jgi:hypothetical protein